MACSSALIVTAILRSCPPDQVAFELRADGDAQQQHGLYTAALLDVIGARVANDEEFILDSRFHADLTRTMQTLAERHAPPAYRDRARRQSPSHEGAALCVVSSRDFRKLKIQRLLAVFEEHFKALRFDSPAAQCCSDTLRQLLLLNYDDGKVQHLSGRIDAAVRERDEARRRLRGEELIKTARYTKDMKDYRRLREEGFSEHYAEVDRFMQEWERAQDEKAWRATEANPSLAAYRSYLQDYPTGQHADAARRAIAALEEDAIWQRAQQSAPASAATSTTVGAAR